MTQANIEEKNAPISNDQWGEMYILTEHWESDLKFYRDDLRFLHHLVDKYFIWITKSENLELVRELMLQVLQLEKDCKKLMARVQEHKSELSKFSMKTNVISLEDSVEHHRELRNSISEFVKGFRANRIEVFRITEYVIDSEELSDLMKS